MHITKINHVYRLYFSAYQQDLLAKKRGNAIKIISISRNWDIKNCQLLRTTRE